MIGVFDPTLPVRPPTPKVKFRPAIERDVSSGRASSMGQDRPSALTSVHSALVDMNLNVVRLGSIGPKSGTVAAARLPPGSRRSYVSWAGSD